MTPLLETVPDVICLILITFWFPAGLLGFPKKDLQYRFLSAFLPAFYIRQRDYSKVCKHCMDLHGLFVVLNQYVALHLLGVISVTGCNICSHFNASSSDKSLVNMPLRRRVCILGSAERMGSQYKF